MVKIRMKKNTKSPWSAVLIRIGETKWQANLFLGNSSGN